MRFSFTVVVLHCWKMYQTDGSETVLIPYVSDLLELNKKHYTRIYLLIYWRQKKDILYIWKCIETTASVCEIDN